MSDQTHSLTTGKSLRLTVLLARFGSQGILMYASNDRTNQCYQRRGQVESTGEGTYRTTNTAKDARSGIKAAHRDLQQCLGAWLTC
jgi:hypothetical protein